MKWLGQYIQSFTARFRDDVYLENLSTTTETSALVVDSDGKISKNVTSGVNLANGADNRIVTAVGTNGLNAEANFTFDGTDLSCTTDTVTFTSANADDPAFLIVNTANDNQACRFRMMKDRGSAQTNNDRVGEMDFVGEDAAGNSQQYGKIMIQALEVTSGQETGKMSFQVAEYDGANTTGLQLLGQDADGEIDVKIGAGAASVTTVAGTLTMGSTATINNSGVIQVAAQTVIDHDQLANFAANEHFTQANITTVGTIDTGVWEGTDVATDQQKHVMHYQTTGYSVPDGTNYDIAKVVSNNQHPFLHDVSIGADGLDHQTVQVWVRSGGHVMPRACNVKRWTGWATAAGSGTHYVGLFKITLTDGTACTGSDCEAVLLEEIEYTAAGNATPIFFNTTSFEGSGAVAAGDIVFTALKGVSGAVMYFNGTYDCLLYTSPSPRDS